MKYKNFNKTDKLRFKELLKMNSEKEFDIEFIRTTNLERQLIDEYGFEGIKLIYENRNSVNYFLLGEFPKNCPWVNRNENKIEEVIEINFAQVKDKLPNLIASMKERCQFIYAEKKDEEWSLHYLMNSKLYDERDYYRVYIGGMPITNSKESKNLLKFKWKLPKDLKEFYTIHNGFGEIYDAGFILNNEEIRIMGEMMNPICEEQNTIPEDYLFDNLLEFFPDGAGNAQCFIKDVTGNNITVDWDHETWEISMRTNFYGFIDDRMSEIDEE